MRDRVWHHLMLLSLLAAALMLLKALGSVRMFEPAAAAGWRSLLFHATLDVPWRFAHILPGVAGAAAAIVAPGRLRWRSAAGMAVLSVAIIAAIDVWLAPLMAVLAGIEHSGLARPAGAILVDAAWWVLPLSMVGVVMGLRAWLHTRVSFGRPADERVAATVTGWLGMYMIIDMLDDWISRGIMGVFEGGSVWPVLVPFVPLAVLAAVGWRKAIRIERQDRVASDHTRAGHDA